MPIGPPPSPAQPVPDRALDAAVPFDATQADDRAMRRAALTALARAIGDEVFY